MFYQEVKYIILSTGSVFELFFLNRFLLLICRWFNDMKLKSSAGICINAPFYSVL